MIRQPRRAGISVPLFSLRSTRSWGIGEIGDIPASRRVAAHPRVSRCFRFFRSTSWRPARSSPYSALSAMAIDPQFISIWMMDDA